MTRCFDVDYSSLPVALPTAAEVHIWLLDVETLNMELIEQYKSYLVPSEHVRAEKFKHNRGEFIVARAFVRLCLAAYTGISPTSLELSANATGKPYLVDSPQPLTFNLSHSGSILALAIGNGQPLGIDIECVRRRSHLEIAKRYFHSQEYQQLMSTEQTAQQDLFLRFWTLKEAFFKALGTGIATGLEKIVFDLSVDSIHFSMAPELGEDETNWQFYQTQIRPQAHLGLASKSSQALQLHWFDGISLFTPAATSII